jgi:orotate phosphoribosyltransferase
MTDAHITAEKLLQSGAVRLSLNEPFTWASGWKSPIYCDNRRVLSQPFIRDYIKSELSNLVFERFPEADAIAGVATAGIAWGALVADQLKLPFLYVRPKPKEHGLGNQIEGSYTEGMQVVVLEDLVSTGKSSLQVVNVLRAAGMIVQGMAAIFQYGFPHGEAQFEEAGVPLFSLTDYAHLVGLAEQKGQVGAEEKAVLLKWQADPASWTGVS